MYCTQTGAQSILHTVNYSIVVSFLYIEDVVVVDITGGRVKCGHYREGVERGAR